MHFCSLRRWRILANPRPGCFLVEVASELADGELVTEQFEITVAETQGSGLARRKVINVDFCPASTPGS
jgi:hypothetical protein